MPTTTKPTTTREYLATLTDAQRAALNTLREAIEAEVPNATEAFTYGMPAIAIDGKTLLWYAAWKKHYSLYPIGESLVAGDPEASAYETAKGTIRFPANAPLPTALVARLTRARLAELRAKGK